MPYCAFCGTQVTPNTPTCPRCGNPPSGVRQPAAVVKGPSSGLPLLIILIVGGFFLIAFLGIIAALLIPNFLDALQKAKQKRTVADLRNVGTAIVSYSVDHNGTLPPGAESGGDEARADAGIACLRSCGGWVEAAFPVLVLAGEPGGGGMRPVPDRQRGADGVLESEDLSKYGQGTLERPRRGRDRGQCGRQIVRWTLGYYSIFSLNKTLGREAAARHPEKYWICSWQGDKIRGLTTRM